MNIEGNPNFPALKLVLWFILLLRILWGKPISHLFWSLWLGLATISVTSFIFLPWAQKSICPLSFPVRWWSVSLSLGSSLILSSYHPEWPKGQAKLTTKMAYLIGYLATLLSLVLAWTLYDGTTILSLLVGFLLLGLCATNNQRRLFEEASAQLQS